MSEAREAATMPTMPVFILTHHHQPHECAAAFAAWSGTASPLRGDRALAGCELGDHRVFWRVEAASATDALALLPDYVAARTTAIPVRNVLIP